MKLNFLHIFGALLIVTTVFAACSKEERTPTLIVNVQEAGGTPAVGATVHAWYGQNNTGGVLNEADFDKTTVTDANGNATFEFKASVVLDVDATYYTVGPDTLRGSKVVKIESVRQRESTNNYNETIVVK